MTKEEFLLIKGNNRIAKTVFALCDKIEASKEGSEEYKTNLKALKNLLLIKSIFYSQKIANKALLSRDKDGTLIYKGFDDTKLTKEPAKEPVEEPKEEIVTEVPEDVKPIEEPVEEPKEEVINEVPEDVKPIEEPVEEPKEEVVNEEATKKSSKKKAKK